MSLEPPLESLGGESRQLPLRCDAHCRLQETCEWPDGRQPVHESRRDRRRGGPPIEMAEQMGAEWPEASFIVVSEKLRLVRGHVHADRAFRLARLARQAEVERVLDLVALPAIGDRLAAQHFEEQMGAATGRVLLVARGHVTRTHGAFAGLAAFADADAPKRRAADAALDRQGKVRLHWSRA